MTLVNDVVSVENFVKGVHPTALTVKQTPPKDPVPNTFVVRFQSERRESETAAHWRADRDYQIVYFGADASDVLVKMDALSKALYQTNMIPINGSLRYIRVESFSLSQPFLTENKLFACIGVMSTQVREARDQVAYDKIMQVNSRFI